MLKSNRICLNCLKHVLSHTRRTKLWPKLNYNYNYLPNNRLHISGVLSYNKDYYEVLGVSRNASQKELKKSYYELAKRYHPDANHGNADAQKCFQEVAEAYSILSDSEKRAKFDLSQNEPQNDDWEGVRRSSFSESFHSSVDAEDMFRKIFGSFRDEFGQPNKKAWVDFPEGKYGHSESQEVAVNLSFKEAAKGCEKLINVNVIHVCEKCNGTRVELGRTAQTCPFCDGVGFETVSESTIPVRTTCRVCKGTGLYIMYKCVECLGFGQVLGERRLIIPVPPGVKDRQTMRVQVEGNELFLTFHVSSSKYFRSVGDDIHTDAVISLSQAVLGGSIKIEGLYTDEKLEINPGTDSHSVLKLINKGLKKSNSYGYGDHYIHIKVKIPKNLSLKQYSLMKSFAELEEWTPGTVKGVEKKQNLTEDDYSARDVNIDDSTFPPLRILKKIFKRLFLKN